MFRKGLVAQEHIQLRQSSPRSLDSSVLKSLIARLRPGSSGANSAQAEQPMEPQRLSFEELDCSTKAREPRSKFSSGSLAHRALVAQFSKSSTAQLRPDGPKAGSAQAAPRSLVA